MPGLNVLRAPGGITQRAPQFLDAGRQRVIANRQPTPDAVEQFLLADQLLPPLGQYKQHGACPRRELNFATVAPKLPGSRIEAKWTKREVRIHGHLLVRPEISRKFPGTQPGLPGPSLRDSWHAAVRAAIRHGKSE
jgi:hypothetical protein